MSDVMQGDAVRGAISTPAPDGLGVTLEALPPRGMVTLRGELGAPAFAAAAEAAAGIPVPGIRQAILENDIAALWMSPDEMLLLLPYDEADSAVARFDAMGAAHALAVNVSDARALFRVSGAKAARVLAKGAPVDLSRDRFGVGDLRRTRIGLVAAAFWKTADDPDSFEILCFRSYAAYLWRWLAEAGRTDSLTDL